MVQTRIEVFPDIPELVDFFEAVPEYDSAMYRHKKMKTTEETSLAVLKEVLPVLEAQEDYTNDPLYASLSAFVKEHGYKNGYVMWPLRTAVSGKQMTRRCNRDHGDHWQGRDTETCTCSNRKA